MAIGTYLVLSLVASAVEGLWLGCRDVWGQNPIRGYRLECRCRELGDAIAERSRRLSDDEIILSPEIEELWRENDRAVVALYLHKGLDPFSGGIAQMYWNGRAHTQKRRAELLNQEAPTDPNKLVDELYARVRDPLSPAVSSAHTSAIGASLRLALPPAH